MSYARTLKRQAAKKAAKAKMSTLMQLSQEAQDYLDAENKKRYEELKELRLDNMSRDLIEAFYCLFGVGLHELYGFGAERIFRVYKWVDDELSKWQTGEENAETIAKRLCDETGVKVEIGG